MKFIVLGAIFYLGICSFMYFRQGQLIFPSSRAPLSPQSSIDVFQTSDGTKLESKFFMSKNAHAPLVILFTGNAQNALLTGHTIGQGFDKSINITTINYRGYGNSEGTPSEKVLFKDALEFVQYTQEKYDAPQVYLMGISLGTAVASYVASKVDIDGLILMTPFDSIENIAKNSYPFLPINLLLKYKFNSQKYLQNVQTAIAIIRAEKDDVVPYKNTEALAKSIQNLVYDETIQNMTHSSILQPRYKERLKKTLHNVMLSFK